MTETQAKSGAAGAPTTQAEPEGADGASAAAGRAAVGRATVPGDSPTPKFTRAPGMPPPPDRADEEADGGEPAAKKKAAEAPAKASARVEAPAAGGGTRPAGATSAGESASKPADAASSTTQPLVTSVAKTVGSLAATATSKISGAARPGAGGRQAPLSAVGAARVSEAVRAARSTVSGAAARGPRRARLNLKRIDPWSVMKFSFAVSIVLFIVIIVATAVLYLALDAMGVFQTINDSISDVISAGGGSGSGGFEINAKGVIGTAALIGLVNVVLVTALATLGAFIYNVCADLVGGIEVTLSERD